MHFAGAGPQPASSRGEVWLLVPGRVSASFWVRRPAEFGVPPMAIIFRRRLARDHAV
jgi:hypothetical protein